MGISSAGIGSGLDVASIVNQLVAAERAPTEARIDRTERRVQPVAPGIGRSIGGRETRTRIIRPERLQNLDAAGSGTNRRQAGHIRRPKGQTREISAVRRRHDHVVVRSIRRSRH